MHTRVIKKSTTCQTAECQSNCHRLNIIITTPISSFPTSYSGFIPLQNIMILQSSLSSDRQPNSPLLHQVQFQWSPAPQVPEWFELHNLSSHCKITDRSGASLKRSITNLNIKSRPQKVERIIKLTHCYFAYPHSRTDCYSAKTKYQIKVWTAEQLNHNSVFKLCINLSPGVCHPSPKLSDFAKLQKMTYA